MSVAWTVNGQQARTKGSSVIRLSRQKGLGYFYAPSDVADFRAVCTASRSMNVLPSYLKSNLGPRRRDAAKVANLAPAFSRDFR